MNRARITGGLAILVAGVLVLSGCGQAEIEDNAQDGSTITDVLADGPFAGEAEDAVTEPVSYEDLHSCMLLSDAEMARFGIKGRAKVTMGDALDGDRLRQCNYSIPDVGTLSVELHENSSTVAKRTVDARTEVSLDRHQAVRERIPYGCRIRADAEWTVVVELSSKDRDLACDLVEQVMRMIEPKLP